MKQQGCFCVWLLEIVHVTVHTLGNAYSIKCTSITYASMPLQRQRNTQKKTSQNSEPTCKSQDGAVNIIRISLSSIHVALDCILPCAAEPPVRKLSMHHYSRMSHQAKLSTTQYYRSIMVFLDSLKDKESLAIQLQQRDSQKIEKCKSLQRRYISYFRQRQNGKFSAEQTPLTARIRAPMSFKQESGMDE